MARQHPITTEASSGAGALEITGLSVEYVTKRSRTRVIDNLTLTLQPDEMLGVVGESGCGKSTLAYSIMRMIPPPGRPVAGAIRFGRHGDLLSVPELYMNRLRGDRIAMIFQGAQSVFNPVRRIGRQVEDVFQAHGKDRRKGLERARELLKATQLDPGRVLKSYPHEMSGGMRQRVAIAMALLLDPEILILDEPTSALDVVSQAAILELLVEIRQRFHVSLIFITHDFAVVSSHADRIAVMYAGHIVEIGRADEIFRVPRHPYTKGLILAIPNIRGPLRDIRAMDGEPPDLSKEIVGCPFAPRCPEVMDACRSYKPELLTIAPGHEAACIRAAMAEAQ